ncbi:MAG: ATP-binding cassette domain-containing protein [Oscillospiraceae bacterium]|nr:ATP-binding cassette domain-containing protein [Oscillospiraceae bacterium]
MNLTVNHGSFFYQKNLPIINDIHFSVDSGEILAILGPNGAGKTTLLRCITGMLKWKHGASLLDGEPIHNMAPKKLWSHMAYVPQAKGASSGYTAFEAVLLGRSSRLHAFSTPRQEDVDKATEVMEQLGIAHLMDKKCNAISGGELQMVLIARALASEPQILILDEPESNLDFKNQLIVLDTITRLSQQGITCIFNTHYPAHALQRSQKALLLSRGGKYVFGSTSSVVTEKNIRNAFGVDAVIGEVETPGNILQNVIPLTISTAAFSDAEEDRNRRSIATITIIASSNLMADKINALLHEYSNLMIGRMGMPYREFGLYLINVTLDGDRKTILELSHRLNILPDVSVKTTFAKGHFDAEAAKEVFQ